MIRTVRQVVALFRYVCARSLLSQRWVPPLSLYLVAFAALFAGGGDARGTGVVSAVLLLPISAWMSTTALNADDTSQVAVVSASMGSYLRGRAVTTITAIVVCGAVGIVGITVALVADPRHGRPGGVLATSALLAVATMTTTIFGATLGSVCARPIIQRQGTSWLIAALVSVIAITAPWSPFTSMVSQLAASPAGPPWPGIARVVAEILAVSTAMFTCGLIASRRMAG